jgi:serine/threonine protein kinase
MPRPHIPRKPPRKRQIPFRFFPHGSEPHFTLVAEDASIRGARFTIEALAQIASIRRAQAVFGNTTTEVAKLEAVARTDDERAGDPPDCLLRFRTRQFPDGHILEGNRASYRIVEFIDAGRSAETYKAVVHVAKDTDDTALTQDTCVVIKAPLFVPYLADAQLTDFVASLTSLFTYEEATLGNVADLDCVSRHLDSGSYPLPRPRGTSPKFMVQQLIQGENLDVYLASVYGTGEPRTFSGLPAHDFCRLATQLASALRDIHSRLVIHGDIWPDNIMVRDSDKKPVLIDFGQAAFRQAIERVVDLSGRNEAYIAPERTRSVAGDVYSLGGVLHYLATGEAPPAPSDDIEEVKKRVVHALSRRNPELYRHNRGAANVIARCLRGNYQRTPHVLGVLEDLELFCTGTVASRFDEVDNETQRIGSAVRALKNPLFQRMASQRFKNLATMVEEMSRGVCDLAGDHEIIVVGLTQFVDMLGKGDEYLTVTVPRFWWPDNLGANGRFLDMNAMAADRGAIIRRLFMIAPADLKHPDFALVVESQMHVLKQMKELTISGIYEVRVMEISEQELSQTLKQRDHFGLLVKGGVEGEIVIYPEYRENGSLKVVRFLADQNLGEELRLKFEDYWHERGVPLDQWFATSYNISRDSHSSA